MGKGCLARVDTRRRAHDQMHDEPGMKICWLMRGWWLDRFSTNTIKILWQPQLSYSDLLEVFFLCVKKAVSYCIHSLWAAQRMHIPLHSSAKQSQIFHKHFVLWLSLPSTTQDSPNRPPTIDKHTVSLWHLACVQSDTCIFPLNEGWGELSSSISILMCCMAS